MNGERRATILGFAAALAVLAVLFWLVGVGDVVAALSGARPPVVFAVVAVAFVWLSAWGLALLAVLRTLGASVSPLWAVLVYAGAVFSNNVTPFGQAGGEPLSALLISRAADSEYETGLAAIASVDALHFLPSIGLATAGIGVFALEAATLGRNLRIAAVAVGGLAVVVAAAAVLGWRYRFALEAAVVRAVTPVVRALGRLLPRRDPPDAAAVERRIDGFFAAIDRVAGDRRILVVALALSAVGWIALTLSLWLSLLSLGHAVPYAAVLVAVPVGSIAGITPLPGGLGGIESVFVVLLVSTTPVPAAVAGGAVLVHRGATYWLPTVIGSGVAATLGAGSR